MSPSIAVESPETVDSRKESVRQPESRFRPILILLSILALFSSSLELELLQHLDGLSQFMTYREIALDGGIALLVMLALGLLWWILLMLVVCGISAIVSPSGDRVTVFGWSFGLALPIAYFLTALLDSIVLRIYPQHHWKIGSWAVLSALLTTVCFFTLLLSKTSRIQRFCSTRLAPIGYFHIALGIGLLAVLPMAGVRPFHDYQDHSRSVGSSNLPDIYLISLDALRVADTSAYGYARPTTPNLEGFGQESFTFEYFFANSNFTTPSTTSMESGLLPWSHRVFQGGGFLRDPGKTNNLSEILRRHGYYTAMISANFFASPVHRRSMDSYDAVEYLAPSNISGTWSRWMNLVGANTQYTLSIPLLRAVTGVRQYIDAFLFPSVSVSPPKAVLDRGRAILEREDINQPRFVWMHILPPHDPYLAPPDYRGRFLTGNKLTHSWDYLEFRNSALPPGASAAQLRARYDEMVLYADHEVGAFLDWLKETGRLNKSIVIITSDHGESFEHNWYSHTGPYLYDGLIHIPLLIHLPGQTQGEHIGQLAQQADLMPTILSLIGIQPPNTDGMSLLPALKGERMTERCIFSMNLEHNRMFDPITTGTIAVLDDHFKYVDYLDRHEEALYEYTSDPTDEHDLSKSEPEVRKRLRRVLLNKLNEVNQTFPQ